MNLGDKTGLNRYIRDVNSLRPAWDIGVWCPKSDPGRRIVMLYSKRMKFGIIRDDKLKKYIRVNTNDYAMMSSYAESIRIYCEFALVRIKDYKSSAEVFKIKKLKKDMCESEELFSLNNILEGYTCGLDQMVRDIVEVRSPDGRNIKFVLSDIELVLPNIADMMKGYNPPKDRRIMRGSTVKIRKKNHLGLACGIRGIVKDTMSAGSRAYCAVDIGGKLLNIPTTKLRVA